MIDHPRPIATASDTGAAPSSAAGGAQSAPDARRSRADSLGGVRASDLMPYTGLRYLSTLFRIMAVILLIVLAAEVVAGFAAQGTASLPTVLGEASRLIVLAGVLWGTGDLASLLIDMGHDVRATRIFLNRQMAHTHPELFANSRGDELEPPARPDDEATLSPHRASPPRAEPPHEPTG